MNPATSPTDDGELRDLLADAQFSDEPGIYGTLAANMEPEYFESFLATIQQLIDRKVLEGQYQILLGWLIAYKQTTGIKTDPFIEAVDVSLEDMKDRLAKAERGKDEQYNN